MLEVDFINAAMMCALNINEHHKGWISRFKTFLKMVMNNIESRVSGRSVEFMPISLTSILPKMSYHLQYLPMTYKVEFE